jgi:hypothetical protein
MPGMTTTSGRRAIGDAIGRLLAEAARAFEARCNALKAKLAQLEQGRYSRAV